MTLSRPVAPRVALCTLVTAALTLSACTQSGSGTDASSTGADSTRFVFGVPAAPTVLDPFYATDGETFRISRQMMEGLVGIKPGSAEIQPVLAERWESTPDGKTWTFTLRGGVTFTDGQPLDAAAVCANFERMFAQNAAARSGPARYWQSTMGAFKDAPTQSLYQGCQAPDRSTAVVKISRPSSRFPTVLALPAFAMQSPKAMEAGNANDVVSTGGKLTYPAYSMSPVGTGPYRLESYDQSAKTVTLVRNDNYWGEKPKTSQLVFKVVPDEATRHEQLSSGDLDGYDLPSPAGWASLQADGAKLSIRPAFNVLYLGLNPQKNPKLGDLRVRQALYYALNRDHLVRTALPEGASVATQLMPPTVKGYNAALQPYPYDPQKARALLKAAGAEGMSVTFGYPTAVSRAYLPDPDKIARSLRADLESVGVKVTVAATRWDAGYLASVDAGRYDAFLLGWTGDYDLADNFLGTFFGNLATNRFHTNVTPYGKTLSDALARADGLVEAPARVAAYEAINKDLQEKYLPALAISHSPSAIVVRGNVDGLVASPLAAEVFTAVTVAR